jgi:hypothetical protein
MGGAYAGIFTSTDRENVMKWLITLSGLALAVLFQHAALATTTLRTAAQVDAEPKFVAADHYGEPVIEGLCIDLFRAIEKTDPGLAFSGDQSWSPSARIDANLHAGVLDVACGMIANRQRPQDRLLQPALFSLRYVLLARAGETATVADWRDVVAMGGNNVVLSMHGTGPSHLLSTIPALRVDAGSSTVQQNLDKLLAGRGRFFYYRLPAAHPVIRRYVAQGQVRVLPVVMLEAPAYMLIGRHVPPATARRIEAALCRLRASGVIGALNRKWAVADAGPAPHSGERDRQDRRHGATMAESTDLVKELQHGCESDQDRYRSYR